MINRHVSYIKYYLSNKPLPKWLFCKWSKSGSFFPFFHFSVFLLNSVFPFHPKYLIIVKIYYIHYIIYVIYYRSKIKMSIFVDDINIKHIISFMAFVGKIKQQKNNLKLWGSLTMSQTLTYQQNPITTTNNNPKSNNIKWSFDIDTVHWYITNINDDIERQWKKIWRKILFISFAVKWFYFPFDI